MSNKEMMTATNNEATSKRSNKEKFEISCVTLIMFLLCTMMNIAVIVFCVSNVSKEKPVYEKATTAYEKVTMANDTVKDNQIVNLVKEKSSNAMQHMLSSIEMIKDNCVNYAKGFTTNAILISEDKEIEETDDNLLSDEFEVIHDESGLTIYVDKDSRVQYITLDGTNLTRVDGADGNPDIFGHEDFVNKGI